MNRLPRRWAEFVTTDFAGGALAGAVAVLPVAAVEQHGPHLPLGTDGIINQGVANAALALLPENVKVILLPMQSVGTSAEHLAFPGTLSLDAPTLIRIWTQLAEGVHRAGLRKLLIFNSHGGQAGLLDVVAADLRARLAMIVAWASPSAFGVPEGAVDAAEAAHGLHGGLKETSMLLHLRPDLVRTDALTAFPSQGEEMARSFSRLRATGRTGFGWQAQDLNPAGTVGNAAAATPELGARLVEHAARGLAELIQDSGPVRAAASVKTGFVAANGLVFEVEQCGEGDRLALCLHGFPELAASWRGQLPTLARLGYRAWAPNLRGYGGSSRPPRVSDYSLEHLMDDVAGLIDASGARSTVLIGHDWGGLVAWCFATRRIRPLDALIALNMPHPACFRAALSSWRQLRKSWYFVAFQLPWLPDWLLRRRQAGSLRETLLATSRHPERFSAELLDLYCRNAAAPGAMTAMLNWYRAAVRGGLARQFKAGFPPIDTPTLIVWGDRDAFIENAALDGTDRYVRDLTIRRLPGISHWVQHEAPEEVNSAIEGFLRTHPATDERSPVAG